MGNRQETEARLIQAVAEVLANQGTTGLGINAIARAAGVNKALIYRYFASLEGLLTAFAASQNFWPDLQEMLGPEPETLLKEPPARLLSQIMRNHCEALLRRPLTIEILAQECVSRDALTIILEEVREARSQELYHYLLQHLQPRFSAEQIRLFFGSGALLSGALQYFLIRARHIKIYGGLDIQSAAGRAELYQLIEGLAQGLS